MTQSPTCAYLVFQLAICALQSRWLCFGKQTTDTFRANFNAHCSGSFPSFCYCL